jgi:hypothetical protein
MRCARGFSLFNKNSFRQLPDKGSSVPTISRRTIAIAGAVFAVTLLVIFVNLREGGGGTEPASPPDVEVTHLDPAGGTLYADLKLINRNSVAAQSPEINCAVMSANGSELSRYRFTIFDTVAPKGTKLMAKYRFGPWPPGAASVTCESNKAMRG